MNINLDEIGVISPIIEALILKELFEHDWSEGLLCSRVENTLIVLRKLLQIEISDSGLQCYSRIFLGTDEVFLTTNLARFSYERRRSELKRLVEFYAKKIEEKL